MDPTQLSDAQLDAAIAQAQAQQPAPEAVQGDGSVVFGGGAPAPGQQPTAAQTSYAHAAQPDPTAPVGSGANPYYDRPGGQAPAGSAHVTQDGQLAVPADQPGGSINLGQMSDKDLDAAIATERAKASPLLDVAAQLPTGLAQGVAGLVGLPGDLLDWVGKGGEVAGRGLAAFAGKPYVAPKSNPREILPGFTVPDSADVNNVIQDAAGERYPDAQTTPGAYARTVASFAPAALAPAGGLTRAASVVVPALASETAGQLTKGSPLEPFARFIGGMAGGVGVGTGAALLKSPEQVVASAARAATPQVLDRADQLMAAGRATGQPLTRAEAIDAASGGATTLNRTVRSVESVKRGKDALAPFYAARPDQVKAAVGRFADSIAPPTTAPGMAGRGIQDAAQTALDQVNTLSRAGRDASLEGASAVDAAPVVKSIDSALASPAGQLPEVANRLNALRPSLFQDDAGMTPAARQAYEGAMVRSMGGEGAAPTQAVMAATKKALGSEFDRIASETSLPFDQQLRDGLAGTLDDAEKVILGHPELSALKNHVQEVAGLAAQNKGQLPGEAYQALIRQGAPLDVLSSNANPNIANYARQIRGHLDDAFERGASPENAAALRAVRSRYRNMKIVQDASNKTVPGQMIEPSSLLASVRKSTPNFAFEGGGDLGNAAQQGLAAQARPPSLQTDPRQLLAAREQLANLSNVSPDAAVALGRVRDSLDGAIGAAAPDYAPWMAGQASLDASHVAPIAAGPIGRMAGTQELGPQIAALYPGSAGATEGTAAETQQAARVLNSTNPLALPQLTRSHIADLAAKATARLQNGLPNANAGPNFAKFIAGNPEQEAALKAGVSELPNGPDRLSDLQRLLDVHRAMGTHLNEGSPTAEKLADAAAMKRTPLGGLLKTNIAEPGEGFAHLLESLAAKRHVDKLAAWLQDQSSVKNTPTAPLPTFPWLVSVPASQQLRLQAR